MISRRRFALPALSAAVLSLAGCGPSEAQQAEALRKFLQTRLLERQGLAVPRPSPEERTAFGRFATDYDVILAFHDRMNESVTAKLGEVIRRGSFNRAEDFMARRADIAAAKDGIQAMASALDGALKDAQTAKAALIQPEGLKADYDRAFERVVIAPAEVLRGVVPTADDIFTQGLAFSDFLTANRAHFKFNGLLVETSRADLLADFNRRAQGLQSTGESLLAAQRRMQALLRGQ